MTAQSSAAKSFYFYNFKPYYLNKMHLLKSQLIMNSILSLLSYPLAFSLLLAFTKAQETQHLQSQSLLSGVHSSTLDMLESLAMMGIIICVLCLVGIFMFTFSITLRSFRYLYDKSAVDMDYVLPVNHNTRFFGDLAAVFTTSILPHLVAVIIGVILFSGITFDIDAAYRTAIIQAMFTGLFSCIMLIGLTLLTMSFCGKKTEAHIYPFLVNIAIPVIHSLCIIIVQGGTYGVNTVVSLDMSITATSPVGMLITAITQLFSDDSTSIQPPVFYPEYGIPALIITLAFFAAAYFLIKYRRTDRVGNSYVFKAMDIIIPGVVIFAITLPLCYMIFTYPINNDDAPNIGGWIAGLIISTFVVYLVMTLISLRSFRKFYLTLAKWAGTMVVCVGISAILSFSNGFGAAYYVPSADSVVEASVWMYSFNETDVNRRFYSFDSTDKDAIASTIEMHELIPKERDDNISSDCYVSLAYSMKNGNTVSRGYYVSSELYEELLDTIITPQTWYADYTAGLFREEIDDLSASINAIRYLDAYYDSSITYEELLAAIKSDSSKVNHSFLYGEDSDSSETYYIEIQSNIKASDGTSYYSITDNIYIYEWMENTIELISGCGVNFKDVYDPTQYDYAFISQKSSDGDSFSNTYSLLAHYVAKEGDMQEYLGESDTQTYASFEPHDPLCEVDTDNAMLAELASECYLSRGFNYESDCEYYIVLVIHNSYDFDFISTYLCVPQEYNDMAQTLMNENELILAS